MRTTEESQVPRLIRLRRTPARDDTITVVFKSANGASRYWRMVIHEMPNRCYQVQAGFQARWQLATETAAAQWAVSRGSTLIVNQVRVLPGWKTRCYNASVIIADASRQLTAFLPPKAPGGGEYVHRLLH